MKSNFNSMLNSLVITGKNFSKHSADRVKGLPDEITNELVFEKENHLKLNSKNMFNQESAKNGILKKSNKSKKETFNVPNKWLELKKVGAGLKNLGNTCFLNSTLQCLIYSKPLFNYLMSIKHPSFCSNGKLCMVCEVRSLMKMCLIQNNHVISPTPILKKLKQIARHMRWGSQEDAHEFLRHVVDAMHRASIHNDSCSSKKSSPIIKLFGGFLKSQIVCMQCQKESIKLDPFLDVSLEVRGVPSIEAGLMRFTKAEMLDGDNAYQCKNCQKKVRAKKRFLFEKLPELLTVQFKRYSIGGGKVSNHISFPDHLNLRPFIHDHPSTLHDPHHKHPHNASKSELHTSPQKPNQNDVSKGNSSYHLYAVLVHEGHSTSSGHYYCYIKAPNDAWFCMNDSHVYQTTLSHVLEAQAYLLFYQRSLKPSKHHLNSKHKAETATSSLTPQNALKLTSATPFPKLLNFDDLLKKKEKKNDPKHMNLMTSSKSFSSLITSPSLLPSNKSLSIFNRDFKSEEKPIKKSNIFTKSLSLPSKPSIFSPTVSPVTSSIKGGKIDNAELMHKKKIEVSIKDTPNGTSNHIKHSANHKEEIIKYTSLWKIKPFVSKSASLDGFNDKHHNGLSFNHGTSNGQVKCDKSERIENKIRKEKHFFSRRSSSGIWKVEKMGDEKVRINKKETKKLEKSRSFSALENGLNHSFKNQNSNEDENSEDDVEENDRKLSKNTLDCPTFKFDHKSLFMGNDEIKEIKKMKKKSDLQKLSLLPFSIPVERWDSSDNSFAEKTRSIEKDNAEARRKRKYQEMDEEIDRGRVKKVKTKRFSLPSDGINLFQKCQNKINTKLHEHLSF